MRRSCSSLTIGLCICVLFAFLSCSGNERLDGTAKSPYQNIVGSKCYTPDDTYPYSLHGYDKLILNEEFNGTLLDGSVWTAHTYGNGLGNNELQYYQPQNIGIANGFLTITARKETRVDNAGVATFNYTSGKISSKGKMAIRYGKIAVRAKGPNGAGMWFAMFLLGYNSRTMGWPACGEMDVVETGLYGQFTNVVAGDEHIAEALGGMWRNNPFFYTAPGYDSSTDFHIYEIEWSPEGLEYYVDGFHTGTTPRTADNAYELDNYYFFILNMAIMSPITAFGGYQTFDIDAVCPQEAVIDWVKIWQKKNEGSVIRNYGTSESVTVFSGGNYLIYSDKTPGVYRYQYTEGENLQWWTPNITIHEPQVDWQINYTNLSLGKAYMSNAYEGGNFLDYEYINTGTWWTGQAWYSEFPLDLRAYTNGTLVFYAMSDSAVGISAGMIGLNASAILAIDGAFGYTNDGQWHKIEIPMSLIAATVDLSQVIDPFCLITSEPPAGQTFRVGIDNIYVKWQANRDLVYLDRTDNTLLFNFQFANVKKHLYLNMKVNGNLVVRNYKISGARIVTNMDGTFNYLWDSGIKYPSGTVIEAQIKGQDSAVNGGIEYFPGGKNDYSAPFVVGTNSIYLDCDKIKFIKPKTRKGAFPDFRTTTTNN